MNKVILPPQTIGIIGGGQLGRMMTVAAKQMGYTIVVLDPTPNCPTAQVADEQIVAAYDDMEAIETLTAKSAVVTYEFENVDLAAAEYIATQGKMPQGSTALAVTQNREREKQEMQAAGLPVPEFAIVNNEAECQSAFSDITFPAVIKTCHGGYDGKGQLKLESAEYTQSAVDFVKKHGHCIIEQWIPFDKEISVVFTRTTAGDMTFFPVAENTHKEHILYQTEVPASISESITNQAIEASAALADRMHIVGTFAIEMFVRDNHIFLNEMAPRPHNSGHYTIEACTISQFAQHIRAVCGLPLSPVKLLRPATMVNILGEDMEHAQTKMAESGEGSFHLYGKSGAKSKRKMGHITFAGDSITAVEQLLDSYRRGSE